MSRRLAAILTALVAVAMVTFAVAEMRPPAPAGERAPAAVFSASRAMAHVKEIAREPRPAGSNAHRRVRSYLFATLAAAGLRPSLQEANGVSDGDRRMVASVANVVGVLPGRDRSLPVVLLVAHYDGVPGSPGAADNASGVAVVLEAARTLASAASVLPTDVVVLFSDGEEIGLTGARAFLEDPASPRVGVVLAFDNAGSAGPSLMYQTSDGNARLVAAFSGTDRALGSSLIDDLVRWGGVQNDSSLFAAAGLPTMSYGFIEGFPHNHTPLDTVDRLAPGSVQEQGEQAVSAVRVFAEELAEAPFDAAGEGDAIYFPITRRALAVYRHGVVVPLAVALVVLYVALVAFGVGRRGLDMGAVIVAAVAGLLALVFIAALTVALWGIGWVGAGAAGDVVTRPDSGDLIDRVALTMLLAAIGPALFLWTFDRRHPVEAALGAAFWWLVLTGAASVALPGASYILAWPLLGALAALSVIVVAGWPPPGDERTSWRTLVVLWVGLLPAVLLFAFPAALLLMVGELRLVVVTVAVWLLAGALVPEFGRLGPLARRLVPAALGIAGLALVVGFGSAAGRPAGEPTQRQAYYRYDATADSGGWGVYLPENDGATFRELMWPKRTESDVAAYAAGAGAWGEGQAPVVRLAAPRVEVVGDRRDGGRRHLSLRVVPATLRGTATGGLQRESALLGLFIDSDVGPVRAVVGGTLLGAGDTSGNDDRATRWYLGWFSPQDEGLVVELEVDAGRSLDLRVAQMTRGLPDAPALQAPARPAPLGPAGIADVTVVQAGYVLGPRSGTALVARPLPADE